MKSFRALVQPLSPQLFGNGDPSITDIVFDSRQVKPGALFVAIRGTKTDGHSHIETALQAGAVAILAKQNPPTGSTVPWAKVGNTLQSLSVISPIFWNYPSRELLTIGLTGTNGKTTSSFLMESILAEAGLPAGLLGTVVYRFGKQERPAPNTTPYASDLQRFMRQVVDQQGKACVMEVSSHALALDRVQGVDFDAALFTNLTQDHLDFHQTMDEYAKAKSLLFKHLDPNTSKRWPRRAVINADDPWSDKLVQDCRVPVIRYGLTAKADVRAKDVHSDASGSRFTVTYGQISFPVKLSLVGDYNVMNALGVTALALALAIPPETIRKGLEKMAGVPGRVEKVSGSHPFTVVVDYAHTEDALRKIMGSLRALKPHKLITVFGCGGDRDRTKRPLMGQAAAEMSDWVYVTSDNPRSEDPEKITLDIEVGVRRVRSDQYTIILDRAEAIRTAVKAAQPGDIVLLAGKGHETYQIIGKQTLPFDDREVARQALSL